MTDEELKTLVASLAIAQQETAQQIKETDKQQKETDKQLKELGKQIGGLGEKFGSFTEGLALPSMTKLLIERFGMEVISPSVRVKKQGENMEIDVLSYANSDINEAYVVEVKSHAREEAIAQLRNILERFRRFFLNTKTKPSMAFWRQWICLTNCAGGFCKPGFMSLGYKTKCLNWMCQRISSLRLIDQQFSVWRKPLEVLLSRHQNSKKRFHATAQWRNGATKGRFTLRRCVVA